MKNQTGKSPIRKKKVMDEVNLKFRISKAILTVAILFSAAPGALGRAEPAPVFFNQIQVLDGFASFLIRSEQSPPSSEELGTIFRLWGVSVSGSVLSEVAGDSEFRCTQIGAVEGDLVGTLRVVLCSSDKIRDLSSYLIFNNLGSEICVETRNRFGTCALISE